MLSSSGNRYNHRHFVVTAMIRYKCPDNSVACNYEARTKNGSSGWCWRLPCGVCLYCEAKAKLCCERLPTRFRTDCEKCQYKFVCFSSVNWHSLDIKREHRNGEFHTDCLTCQYTECVANKRVLTRFVARDMIRYAENEAEI